jgi:hypothetical protein
MKKLTTALLLIFSILAFNNCSDEVTGTKDLNYIAFQVPPPTIIVEKNGTITSDIHVYTTQVASSDRTFDVKVVAASTTANAASYKVPESVTVPANSNDGKLTITVSDTNLGVDPVTLALEFGASDGLFTGSKTTLKILKHCSLNINDFVGTYAGTTYYGPTKVVTSLNSSGKLQITGIGVAFFTGYWGEVITSMQTLPMNVDLATGNFTIALADYVVTSYKGETQPVYKLSATGNLNACSGTMYLYYDFNQAGIGSYLAWNQGFTKAKFTEIIKLK